MSVLKILLTMLVIGVLLVGLLALVGFVFLLDHFNIINLPVSVANIVSNGVSGSPGSEGFQP